MSSSDQISVIKVKFYTEEKLSNKMTNSEKILAFIAAVRRFHYYQRFWIPEENEKLDCSHGRGNFYDRFTIKKRQEMEQPLVIYRRNHHAL